MKNKIELNILASDIIGASYIDCRYCAISRAVKRQLSINSNVTTNPKATTINNVRYTIVGDYNYSDFEKYYTKAERLTPKKWYQFWKKDKDLSKVIIRTVILIKD